MAANLKDYFPIIRKREEILSEIKKTVSCNQSLTAGKKPCKKNF